MQFEEHISAFMDGTLCADDEVEFLHILSVSPEKRAQFHELLSLRGMLAADARSITVPPRLDAAVYAAAGLGLTTSAMAGQGSIPAAASGSVVNTLSASLGASAAWWSAGRIAGAIALAISLFTAGYIVKDLFSDYGLVTTREGMAGEAKLEAKGFGPTLPGSVEERRDNAPVRDVIDGGLQYRTVVVTRIDTVYLSSPSIAEKASPHVIRDTELLLHDHTVQTVRPITILESPVTTMKLRSHGGIDIEVQREHLSTWPYIDYQRAAVQREQREYTVYAAYTFDKYHAAGLMLGQKSFSMEYYRIERDSLFIYQSQPAMLHGGGFYRLSFPVATGVTPEVMLQLSGSDPGPVVGGRIALRLTPLENISVVFGANASLLAYKYKEKVFTSHSLGFTYGVRYQF